MIRLFVRHQVSDFDEWKLAYDAFKKERVEMIVLNDDVFQSVIDPEDITIWLDFKTVEAALTFVASPMLEQAMEMAGVTDEPVMWIAREA